MNKNNMFFFYFNDEKRIGVKKLSEADLGLSKKSNQTHIGLYEDVLTYFENNDVEEECLFIYNDTCLMLNCIFDRIENPDGTYRSPKIRKGKNGNSIVEKIRQIAKEISAVDWYLVWTGLESEQLVFWLFNSNSDDYIQLSKILSKFSQVIRGENKEYQAIKKILEYKINITSFSVQKDIEISSQLGKYTHRYKRADIETAQRLFREIGKEGELLVAEYLEKEKLAKRIHSYRWMNKNSESGEPFDFLINENLSDELFVDVKSTRFDFNQHIFFSDNEVNFINSLSLTEKYSVYRLFDMKKDKKMIICNHCMPYMTHIQNEITKFFSVMSNENALLQSIKFGVKPNDCFNTINEPIML